MSELGVIYYSCREVEGTWKTSHFLDELPRNDIPVITFENEHTDVDSFSKTVQELKKKHRRIIALIAADDTNWVPRINQTLREQNIPSVLFCADNLHIPFRHRKTARHYDLVWLTSRETEPLFQRWGARTIFLPYAANPYVFQARNELPELPGVGFIGKPYGARWDRICKLTEAEIPVSLYAHEELNTTTAPPLKNLRGDSLAAAANMLRTGEGRKCVKGALKKSFFCKLPTPNREFLQKNNPVDFKTMIDLYNRYMLILGTCDVWNTFILKNPLLKTHLRAFEVPMAGGIHLVNRSPEIMEFFSENEEVLCYGSDEEMIDKAKFYRRPDQASKRHEIRRNARDRCLAEHTWTHRFKKLFKRLE